MTGQIILYRYMALDSASLANLARDNASDRIDRREVAHAFLASIEAENWLLLISMDAVLELIQHGDDRVARQFPDLLKTIPEVAWIASRLPGQTPGGIIDILHCELRAVLDGASTLRQVVAETREGLFEIGPGHVLLRAIEPNLVAMRAYARQRASARQRIASLSRVDHSELLRYPLAELNRLGTRAPHTIVEVLSRELRTRIHEQLSSRSAGLDDPSAVTEDFLSSCAIDILCASAGSSLTPDDIMRYFGLDPGCISPDVPAGEVAELAEFIAKARVALRNTRVSFDPRLYQVARSLVPSWIIAQELHRKRLKTYGARASDLTDAHLAALLPYADLTEVDKRTWGYLARITTPTAELGPFAQGLAKGPYYPEGRRHFAAR